MAAPFALAIKGTTSTAPGTGSFTPNAAAAGHRPWSAMPNGWIGLVRYEDGTAWELRYGYWNGTVITRPSNIVDSSTGSALTLSASATATAVIDPDAIQPHLGVASLRAYIPLLAGTTFTSIGWANATITGTASAGTVGNSSAVTEMPRVVVTSATTANAQAALANPSVVAMSSSVAGRGGWEFTTLFGVASALPTGPRVFMGLADSTFVGAAGEPSAKTGNYAVLGKDSTDTNLQLITNSGVSSGTKIDTGIPLAAFGVFECTIWTNPGSTRVYMLLCRCDTGAIFYTSTTTDVPASGTAMALNNIGGLSATTGTAFALAQGPITIRSGG